MTQNWYKTELYLCAKIVFFFRFYCRSWRNTVHIITCIKPHSKHRYALSLTYCNQLLTNSSWNSAVTTFVFVSGVMFGKVWWKRQECSTQRSKHDAQCTWYRFTSQLQPSIPSSPHRHLDPLRFFRQLHFAMGYNKISTKHLYEIADVHCRGCAMQIRTEKSWLFKNLYQFRQYFLRSEKP